MGFCIHTRIHTGGPLILSARSDTSTRWLHPFLSCGPANHDEARGDTRSISAHSDRPSTLAPVVHGSSSELLVRAVTQEKTAWGARSANKTIFFRVNFELVRYDRLWAERFELTQHCHSVVVSVAATLGRGQYMMHGGPSNVLCTRSFVTLMT